MNFAYRSYLTLKFVRIITLVDFTRYNCSTYCII